MTTAFGIPRSGLALGKPGPQRPAIWWRDIGREPAEEALQRCDLLVRHIPAEQSVEGEGRLAQPPERPLPCLGELHHVDPPVRRVTLPGNEAGCLHRVQMMRERGFLD